ncbi:MAG TPA: hypothetical protein VKY71_16125 [Actinotalea caeni]|uniref:hypothetical protein n=1 Tax=Actinotalea caeni TaxID=1348467 RepID=UPI0012E19E37|nr:hypothetical protein [Actinotalea caeni]HLV57086.1 hypothetical protein [Actinotalea caeni]
MTWVTWVTWGFVALAALVVGVAVAASRGRLDLTMEPPYEPPPDPGTPRVGRPGVEWHEPAGGPVDDQMPAPDPQHHPRTTGEPADGSHEAQDR